ncbi:uncharacterized protein LOC128895802 [Hylaeus anthracinus]|uniref:uncharacterized protein LOC128895802 n=1 Tax=Hylaeus anthracinus TaxID=313031 RepID=UPI0023B97160|nr:uncharacterized protein LOC128895802 [Hylaeus anthracinus]
MAVVLLLLNLRLTIERAFYKLAPNAGDDVWTSSGRFATYGVTNWRPLHTPTDSVAPSLEYDFIFKEKSIDRIERPSMDIGLLTIKGCIQEPGARQTQPCVACFIRNGAPSWLNAEHAIDRYLFPLSFADCSIELHGCVHPVPTKFEGFFALPIYLGTAIPNVTKRVRTLQNDDVSGFNHLTIYVSLVSASSYNHLISTMEIVVALGGLADQAGVKAGDVIIKVNGETIQHLRHCEVQERLVKARNEFTLTVLRNLKFERAVQQE